MNMPLKITILFVASISVGLILAYIDGISLHAIKHTALIAFSIGFSVALLAWTVSTLRKPRD